MNKAQKSTHLLLRNQSKPKVGEWKLEEEYLSSRTETVGALARCVPCPLVYRTQGHAAPAGIVPSINRKFP